MLNEYLQESDYVGDFNLNDWGVGELMAADSLLIELHEIAWKEGYLTALNLEKLERHLSDYIDTSISEMLEESSAIDGMIEEGRESMTERLPEELNNG